jgi:hypothetical protein
MVPNDTASPMSHEPVSSLLIKTLIAAFTFLTALSIRDSIMQGMQVVSPNDTIKRLAFTVTMTGFFLFVTVLMAFLWQDKISD